MDDVEEFLQEHRLKLLRYLDGNAPISPDDPGPTDYLRQVLDEWSKLSSGRELDEPCLREPSINLRNWWRTRLKGNSIRMRLCS